MARSDGGQGGIGERTAAADGGEPGVGGDGRLPESVVADLRGDEFRRRALARLVERDEPVPVSDLAREAVAAERDEDPPDVPADAVDAARAELFQEHLPKLTATGVVSYDSLVGTVELSTDDPRLIGGDADAGEGSDEPVVPE
ncbi:DUF7344 domain-containing protein [Halosimplex marinum]|uniref:DUF7344 domain-containing protein n=1 Tax=Halosimplex marinum TaxID=3396620 RepID=UPI003F54B735